MKKKREAEAKLVAVKIPSKLDRAVEVHCSREGILKRAFFEIALREKLEAINA